MRNSSTFYRGPSGMIVAGSTKSLRASPSPRSSSPPAGRGREPSSPVRCSG